MNVLTAMVEGSTDVENFNLKSQASVGSERGKEGMRVAAAMAEGEGKERRDVGEKIMEHGGAWQHGHHGGDKYRV